jgi:hypothetical protein
MAISHFYTVGGGARVRFIISFNNPEQLRDNGNLKKYIFSLKFETPWQTYYQICGYIFKLNAITPQFSSPGLKMFAFE